LKSCPTCNRLYPDDAGFCPIDGTELRSASLVPPPADANDPRIGTTLFNRYQVRRVVADGGMGRVYEALDQCDRRAVAIKVLHADVARDSVALERFKREFQISELLPHEHIVAVLDFQRAEDGSHVLVMDYLEGEELRSVLKREKAIRAERIVRMLSQLAIGLDEAHRRQLIHRDLKPDNIFLCGTREGDVVKLLDFGSVKDKSEGAKKLTVMGTTIGSPYYMSPEQAQGLETLDARADVWALAAIAYEALTGQVPFRGNNGPSILLAILTQQPVPPSQLGSKVAKSQIPPTIDDVLDEAFAKNVGMRVTSVGALADRFGHAYGLTGTHRDWAYTPVQQLSDRIEAALPSLVVAKPSAVGVEADPFAEPDPFKTPAPQAAAGAALAQMPPAAFGGAPMGTGAITLPGTRNNLSTWLIIGAAALLAVLGAGAVVLWLVLRR
jgi:serine/threonine protein kinase